MSKMTGLVGALGAFGALAYLLAPLPPDAPSANMVAKVTTSGKLSAAASASTPDVPASVARLEPADATVRLVQQIQTELLRLGCYDGAVDGRWSSETQQAMQTLGERVRVLRPVDTPDYIMLALARGQASHSCVERARATVSRESTRMVPMAAPWQSDAERTVTTTSRRQSNRTSTAAAPAARNRPLAFSEARSAPAEARSEELVGRVAGDGTALSPMDRETLELNRMGLGAAPMDPLLAPATPVNVGGIGSGRDPSLEVARPAAQRARPAPEPSRVARTDWKRDFFRKLSENGP